MAVAVDHSVLAPNDAPAIGAPEREAARHPHRKSAAIVALGYMVITVTLLAIGMLLTHALAGSVGRWDEHVNEYFARNRTATWNDITKYTTASFNTTPVVVAAVVVVGFLLLRRHVREAAFLTLALLIEITAFLSVTFVVARPRPDVVRLNATPATSSFPSGHTAAATVMFVGVAIIVFCCSARVFLRVAVSMLATLVVIATGFARVYRGLHHPTDVFVGALFGLACLAVAGLAVRAHNREWRAQSEDPAERRQRDAGELLQR